MHRTLILCKGGRSVSTRHGQRSILKYIPPVKEYIEKAVETGIYRTSDEIDAAMDALRKGHGNVGGVEPRVAVDRFRRDIVRGTEVQDYPPEYHILCQHPPIPPPPRTPKKIERRMLAEQPKHPTGKLVQKYFKRQPKPEATTEDYYKKLLGIQPPAENYSMGQKSASLSKAYAFAMKQYQVMRTQDVSEKEALDIVEKLLAEEKKEEGQLSREITHEIKEWEKTAGMPHSLKDDASAEKINADQVGGALDLPSILHDKPRVVEGMMQWSRMLQNSGIPYHEWTVGASTALDHWIARNILQLSEATWDALLEGNDPSLLGRGQDIVAIRETLFPETILEVRHDEELYLEGEEQQEEWKAAEEQAPLPSKQQETPLRQKSVDELLKSLRGLDSNEEQEGTPGFAGFSEKPPPATGKKYIDPIDVLTKELQQWRAQNFKSPYNEWPEHEKEQFMVWLDKYIKVLISDEERPLIDRDQTRIALLSDKPQTEEESDKFWDSLQDETKADLFLQNLLQKGPPEGLSEISKVFWSLPYDQQLERLMNLGAVRPLVDDYMSDEERQDFLRRYGDLLLDGVVMDYLVPDPHGPVTGKDIGIDAVQVWRVQKEERFKLVKIPYRSGLSGNSEVGGNIRGSDAALERSRALYQAWNHHKASRARYEEALFIQGDLGLSYSLKSPNQIQKDKDMEERKKNK